MTPKSANHVGLPRRTSADTEGDVQRVLAKVEKNGTDFTITRVLANSSHVFRPFALLTDALLNRAVLPQAVREAVILAIAASESIGYEWAEHVPMAKRAGLSDEQIEAIEAGNELSGVFDADTVFAVGVARGLRAGKGIDADDWQRVVDTWDVDGALDLVFTVGWWGGFVKTFIEGMGLTAEDVRR